MGRTRIPRVASCVLLLCAATVDAVCPFTELWIDSVNLAGISGCFVETIYFGLHATTVWTLGGVDIAPSGTTGIIAEMPDGASFTNDPIWSIGTVMPNATNTWSDGYQVGLWVEVPVCAGTSPFWETADPSEETQWSCDSNNDGTLTVGEGNGFVVTCGCPDENGVVPTLTPTLSPVPNSQDPTMPVVAPTEAPVSMPISTPSTLEPTSPTTSSSGQVDSGTPSPLSDGTSSQACNLTLASDSIPTVDGCYFQTTSENSRGRWMKPGGLVSMQWENSTSSGYWVVVLAGVGGVDEYICTNDEDIDDPTALDVNDWICEIDLPEDERGSIDELECNTELCENSQGTSNDGLSAASTTAIVAGSVIGGFMLAGLILVGLFVIKRRRGEKAKEVEPATESDSPADPDAPPEPVPVFEPWGTRPPPKCYG